MKINKTNINDFLAFLDERFFNAHCELNYHKDYELVIAVMLSAQTTDAKVNKVTAILFDKYQNLEALKNANLEDIISIIRPLGLAKNKAKNVIGIATKLLEEFDGKVPSDKDALINLPGVGNKSAGVIRAEVFMIPDLPVDTHVMRVSKRLGIASEKDMPIDIELKLKKLIKEDRWIKSHHQIIFFGRYLCTAKNPKCNECKLCKYCRDYKALEK